MTWRRDPFASAPNSQKTAPSSSGFQPILIATIVVLAAAYVTKQACFGLGFGGTLTFDRSLQIRRLATELPEGLLLLETDAPDIPPHWLYRTAAERAVGAGSPRNEPAELPRIAESLAALRGWTPEQTASITSANCRAALPRLALLDADGAFA